MTSTSNMVREIIDSRELLWALTWRDIRVKYKQAVMGVLWVFFVPVVAIGAGILVQAALAYLRHGHLTIDKAGSVMVRTVPWSLFSGVLAATVNGLLGGMSLGAKIYFPRQIIPLSAMLGVLFDFAISTLFVALLLVFLPGSPLQCTWWLLLLAPLLAVLLLQSLGLGLLFGSANMFFRDVKYIVSTMLQFGIYFSPVMLFMDDLPPALQSIVIWNPVAPVLEAMAMVTTRGTVEAALWGHLAYSAACAVVFMALGVAVFRRTEPLFAEVV
jgi:lipopolysaccharide transport system permease protein